jgi:biotin transporter BioY
MTENIPKPAPLRIVAALILGIFGGFLIFFIFALLIGLINDLLKTSLTINTNLQDIWSVILLVVIIVICTAGMLWLVYKTPPTPESED